MDNNSQNKTSTVASLIFHGLLIFALIWFKSAHILVPSRSSGIQVSLISSDDLTPLPVPVPAPKVDVEPIKTLATPADVNFKEQVKPKVVITPAKVITPPPLPKVKEPKVVPSKPAVAKSLKPKVKPNAAINDLVNDLTPSTENTGISKNVATGGANGSSDTSNLVNNYADLVIERVRPYVIIPDGLDSTSVATVEVTLLPNMQVYAVKLIQSSGNTDYDNNVEQAINRVNVFPPLPDGASFADYRKLRLVFHPQ